MTADIVKGRLDGVDGVVFDFGGVIVRAPKGEWKVLDLCQEAGLGREAAYAGIVRHRRDFDGGHLTCREMYERIFRENGLPLPEGDFFDKAYRLDSEGWTDFSATTLDLMRFIKGRGLKLGILSNMSAAFHADYFVRLAGEYRSLCDSEVISSHVRLTKPDKAIYDISQREMGIPCGRLLFLDDNLENVEAARRYGWRSEVFEAT